MLRRVFVGLAGAVGAVIGGGALAGWFLSAPKYRGPKSDHFDGNRFHNIAPTVHADAAAMVKWLANRDEGPWDQWREIAPAPPPPKRVAGSELRVTLVNHATLLIQTGNVNILTDPMWSDRCSPFPFIGPKRHHAPGIRFEDLPPIDAVVISHNHYDHLDVPTLQRLVREHKPRIFTALGNDAFLRGKGIEGAEALDWWQSAPVYGVRVHVVPAQHFSSRGTADRDANLWCGYVIETPHGSIYFAGDTGWGPHFQLIRERYGAPRLALLPIGAYRPEWFMCAVHISPQDAIRAAQVLGAAVSIPMHYGTFHLGDDGQDEPAEVLRRELVNAPGVRFEVLAPGEAFTDAPS
ncbi:MAG TPA: MBL fold metallo-hydrolase [Thermoanaerobaculia bacterium]|nr:MBL fold metallo-hydrolase [Thermoanaerobaculia bacterium]